MPDATNSLLALECSGQICSVALQYGGDIRMLANGNQGRHSQHVLRLAKQLLDDAGIKATQLDAITFGKGPGSFTGIRIAAATAMGLATGADLGVIPISNLAAIAQAHSARHQHIAVACNARLGDIYHGTYHSNNDTVQQDSEDKISKIADMPELRAKHYFGAGDGWQLGGMDKSGLYDYDTDTMATALHLLELAPHSEKLDPEHAVPSYIRQQVATPNVK